MKKYIQKRRGSALAIVLVVMTVLSILGAVVLRVAASETRFAVNNENKLKAHYIARSGVQSLAEYMIRNPYNDAHKLEEITDWSDWNTQVGGGSFRIKVEKDSDSKIIIISESFYNGVKGIAKARLDKSIFLVGGIFNHAIAAKGDVDYDKGSGNGIIITGSVATKNGEIDLGKSNDSTTKVTDKDLEFYEINYNRTYNATMGVINNNLVIDTESKYYLYSTGINLGPNGKIHVKGGGTVHLYVKGSINFGNNIEILTEDNSKLFIYTDTTSTIVFKGANNKANINNFVLYAPFSTIEWGSSNTGHLLGALYGNKVKFMNQIQIIYDLSLIEEVDFDVPFSGVEYEGYVWID